MIQQQIRQSGNSLVVTIPKEEVERLNLTAGQFVAFELIPLELRPIVRPEIQDILDRTLENVTPALKYLADR